MFFRAGTMLQDRATEIAVSALSPVTMTTLICALFRWRMIFDVMGLSLFSRTKKPRKVIYCSRSSRSS